VWIERIKASGVGRKGDDTKFFLGGIKGGEPVVDLESGSFAEKNREVRGKSTVKRTSVKTGGGKWGNPVGFGSPDPVQETNKKTEEKRHRDRRPRTARGTVLDWPVVGGD